MNELDSAALRAAVLKVLVDRVTVAFKRAKDEVAVLLGPEGRKNAVWERNKIASVSVTKTGRVTIDEETFSAWVAEHYPTEAIVRPVARAAFMEAVRRASADAGEPCTPFGDLDVPGINIGEHFATVRPASGAEELVAQLWERHLIDLDLGVRRELTEGHDQQ